MAETALCHCPISFRSARGRTYNPPAASHQQIVLVYYAARSTCVAPPQRASLVTSRDHWSMTVGEQLVEEQGAVGGGAREWWHRNQHASVHYQQHTGKASRHLAYGCSPDRMAAQYRGLLGRSATLTHKVMGPAWLQAQREHKCRHPVHAFGTYTPTHLFCRSHSHHICSSHAPPLLPQGNRRCRCRNHLPCLPLWQAWSCVLPSLAGPAAQCAPNGLTRPAALQVVAAPPTPVPLALLCPCVPPVGPCPLAWALDLHLWAAAYSCIPVHGRPQLLHGCVGLRWGGGSALTASGVGMESSSTSLPHGDSHPTLYGWKLLSLPQPSPCDAGQVCCAPSAPQVPAHGPCAVRPSHNLWGAV